MVDNGFRYKSKEGGSPFGVSHLGACTMSCFVCGKHRNRSLLKTRRVLGRTELVCAPNCKELQITLEHVHSQR